MDAVKNRTDHMARVLIVDDHPIVREGYRQLISSQPDLEVCGLASGEQAALGQVKATDPDVVVIDIALKEGNGIELVKQLSSRYGNVKMLVVSAYDESLFAERALRAGALGYVSKQAAPEEFIDAIHKVLRGEVYLSGPMTRRMLRRTVGIENDHLKTSPVESLSDRELQVFEFMGQGLTTRQIAERLYLSPKTIETYRENIKKKLDANNGAELTRLAVQWALESMQNATT